MIQERKTIVAGPHILRIDVSELENVYFTSDIHINHDSIIKYCNRPFKDVNEMNTVLIDNINKTIGDNTNAILINCGDFIFRNVGEYEKFIDSINAKKIYNIIGNHDIKNIIQRRYMIPYDETAKTFWSSELIVEIREGQKIHTIFTVSHYPHCDGQFMGSFNIHGHLHTPKNIDDYTGTDLNIVRKLREKRICYDVGVDGNDYKPVKLTDILTGNLIMYQISQDHINFNKWKEIIYKEKIFKTL